MNGQEKKKELSPELRIVVASLLSMLVILAWIRFFAPKPPVNAPQANRPGQAAPATTSPGTPQGPGSASPTKSPSPAAVSAPSLPAPPPKADKNEQTYVIENALYRVEISNRGGVVKSWQLKKYLDDAKPPRVLDVVHPEAAAQVGGWPFALVLDDAQLEAQANAALFLAEAKPEASSEAPAKTGAPAPAVLEAPAALQLSWSDGRLEVSKTFHFDHSYVVRVEASAKFNGMPIKAGLAWLGGFGDLTVSPNPAPVESVYTFYSENGSLTSVPHKKLEGPEKWAPGLWQGGKDWAGIQDRYFVAAFLPLQASAPGAIETRYWKVMRGIQVEGKDEQEPVPEVAAASPAQALAMRVYVGPKDYDILKALRPQLHALVNFGWLEIIADPLFHALKWIHNYVPNWGWSIVVLTVIITLALFPLRIKGYRATLKMQRVAPEIKQIQDRYKKYKMNDPKKQEMNKEVMAVYSREGINPVGGCIPQLIQLPIWYGLYRALYGTIELRHAPWFWWIKDLSAKDPYYILPLLMGLSMYISSKITPVPTTDPQQQAMAKWMPIMMSGIFFVIPYPSGLAVYILTSYALGAVQQWYLNRRHPLQAVAKPVRGKKSSEAQAKSTT
ncbi:MAG TPA: membrane protein insertase YidC [Candidatus Acidoferrum sp.]|nr:membrane protein insertase YidC [Candidatus Acidoferrum sp.]